jgi:pimeloyl-ACP methyl ester carboxylesterase
MTAPSRDFRERTVTLTNGLILRVARAQAESGVVAPVLRADDLRKYAARAACPVVILRGSASSELTLAQAKEIAGCWKNAVVVDVEGDYALQMDNPYGLAQALSTFAAQAVRD